MSDRQAVLWTAKDAAIATGGVGSFREATGVSIDSRTVEPGDLFVAIEGPTHDGHDFIAAALAAGAVAAVADRVPAGLSTDAPLLRVADTMQALVDLGRAARARTQARIVAITGSVGKTGGKEMLRLALSPQGSTVAAADSYNNQWGVPLSLARMPRDTAFGVFELGMNRAGEIAALTHQVRPDVAIITTVEPVHLEFFPSVEAIADAKAEIFQGMLAEGAAILNRDNPHFARLAVAARAAGLTRIIGFGRHGQAEARLIDALADANGSVVIADILGQRVDYRLNLPGQHWIANSLGVLAGVKALGADVRAGAAALAAMRAMKGRGERHAIALPGGTFQLIDESYNASPVAVRAALKVLAATTPAAGGRRIAVLGDMRELGTAAPALHAGLVADVLAAGVDLVFTAGPLMGALHVALPKERRGGHVFESAGLTTLVAGAVRPGDVVLVKGSLGSRMGPIAEALKSLHRDGPRARAANGA